MGLWQKGEEKGSGLWQKGRRRGAAWDIRWEGLVAEGEGEQSESWQMKSYTYQDEQASIHVVNVHNTYKHNMVYT